MPRNTSLLYNILFICIGILYPAYCSLFALQTPDKKDDNLWLIYWVVFAVFNVFEILTDFVFSWLPFYPVLKLGFLMWCNAPFNFNGAYYTYKNFLGAYFSYVWWTCRFGLNSCCGDSQKCNTADTTLPTINESR